MRTVLASLFSAGKQIAMIVVLGLVAGLLAPGYAADNETNIARAQADMQGIKAALDRFRADNAAWPNRVQGADAATNSAEVLYSAGNAISSPNTWPVNDDRVYKELASYFAGGNEREYPAKTWKGPYLAAMPADPWGNTYLVGIKNAEKSDLPVWIISAGPDGILQTPMDSPVCMDGKSLDPASGTVAAGDDICLKYK